MFISENDDEFYFESSKYVNQDSLKELKYFQATCIHLLFDESSIKGLQNQIKRFEDELLKFNIVAGEVDFNPDGDVEEIQEELHLSPEQAEEVWCLFQGYWFHNYILDQVLKDGSCSLEFQIN